eukprot:359919-Chlamydomonas_euryale.AAC.8
MQTRPPRRPMPGCAAETGRVVFPPPPPMTKLMCMRTRSSFSCRTSTHTQRRTQVYSLAQSNIWEVRAEATVIVARDLYVSASGRTGSA